MFEKVAELYTKAVGKVAELYTEINDQSMALHGFIPEARCTEVFGGIPEHDIVTAIPLLAPKLKYVGLGQFKRAYEIIVEAAKKGEKSVTLTDFDFFVPLHPCSPQHSFNELLKLRARSRKTGRECLIRDMDLDYVRLETGDLRSLSSPYGLKSSDKR